MHGHNCGWWSFWCWWCYFLYCYYIYGNILKRKFSDQILWNTIDHNAPWILSCGTILYRTESFTRRFSFFSIHLCSCLQTRSSTLPDSPYSMIKPFYQLWLRILWFRMCSTSGIPRTEFCIVEVGNGLVWPTSWWDALILKTKIFSYIHRDYAS